MAQEYFSSFGNCVRINCRAIKVSLNIRLSSRLVPSSDLPCELVASSLGGRGRFFFPRDDDEYDGYGSAI